MSVCVLPSFSQGRATDGEMVNIIYQFGRYAGHLERAEMKGEMTVEAAERGCKLMKLAFLEEMNSEKPSGSHFMDKMNKYIGTHKIN